MVLFTRHTPERQPLPDSEPTSPFVGWAGFRVVRTDRYEKNDQDRPTAQVWIELASRRHRRKYCSICKKPSRRIHDWQERWVRDLPILDAQTYVLVPICRVKCKTCGVRREHLPWLPNYARVTNRLAGSVARLCGEMPVKWVASWFGLTWDQVKAIDKAHLDRTLNPVDLEGVEELMIDEFALHKGHRYATVITDAKSRRVLWVGPGRSRESIRPFFKLLGPEGCKRIKAVAMDMSAGFEHEFQAQCPQASIVFDFFHVVAKYGREVISRVRVDEANRVKNDKPQRKLIKGSKWLLLCNPENLGSEKRRIRLEELLSANKRLAKVYLLKEDLKQLWGFTDIDKAAAFWKDWYHRAIRSRIKPLKKFARAMAERLDGLLAHCKHPLNTSVQEGINNKIKVLKRMAYGYRDEAYFFLKIRAAFPGKAG